MTIFSNNCSNNTYTNSDDANVTVDHHSSGKMRGKAKPRANVTPGTPPSQNATLTEGLSPRVRPARAPKKMRLDLLLVEQGLVPNKDQAQRLIMAGEVLIGEEVRDKPGHLVPTNATIRLRTTLPYVSRGGVKLAGALDEFQIDVAGLTAIDVGASTGGFTDCLLQRGAARVFAIDVGYGQLAWKLRSDPRVIVMERTNIRMVEALPENTQADLAVIDASFISLALVLPATIRLLRPQGEVIALVKPQFEADKAEVGKGGVVREEKVHRAVLEENHQLANQLGLTIQGMTLSPLLGPAGNVEFLIWYISIGLPHVQLDAPQREHPHHAIDVATTTERVLAQALAMRRTN